MKINWWQWRPFQPWRIVGFADSADEVPNRLPRNGIILVGDQRRLKWLVFDCPCRTRHRIMLNADPARRPMWKLSQGGRPTILPSIDYRGQDRRCHYFLRNGRIAWAEDSDR